MFGVAQSQNQLFEPSHSEMITVSRKECSHCDSPPQTGSDCISISLCLERTHLFIVRVGDSSRSLVSLLQKYVPFTRTAPSQGDEMQPDRESDRKQGGSLRFYLHSCPSDVTQHFSGCFFYCVYNLRRRLPRHQPLTWKVHCWQEGRAACRRRRKI